MLPHTHSPLRARPLAALCLPAVALLAGPTAAGTEYRVTWTGEVEFNGINSGPLSNIAVGESATLEFLVDEDVFVDSGAFPTRGYTIDESSWAFDFDSGSVGLQSPFPGTPLFVLRDNDPGVDGFFVADNVNFPTGVPLEVPGAFGQFRNNVSVTYDQTTLPSLDVADAVGSYDFTGLSVFNWTIDDGGFNPFGIVFESLTIVEVVPGTTSVYGCAVNPAGSMSVLSGTPSIGAGIRLGIDNPLGTQDPGSLPAVIVGVTPLPTFPCGLSLPGAGMAGPGASGELLLLLDGMNPVLFGSPWTGPGNPAPVDVPIPDKQVLVGFTVYLQGLLIDAVAAQGVPFGLTDAVELTIGN